MSKAESLALRGPYSTPQQQRDASTLGMWVFLATEVLFFGGLFVSFAVYRMYYTQGFLEGSQEMDLIIGTVNTVVITTSTLTICLALRSIDQGNQYRTYWLLLLTAFLGVVFLSLKFTEYILHYQDHKVPGIWFESNKPDARSEELFFVFYFTMTGLHVIHMTIGTGLLVIMAVRTALGRFNQYYHTAIDLTALYWDFVDIVWIFLYAIFYIPGFH